MSRCVCLWILLLSAPLVCSAVGVAGEPPPRIRVLSYNIHHGEGSDRRIDLERVAKVIRDTSAEVVALQEVDRMTERSGGVDQAAELARLTDMRAVFGRNIEYQGGGYGNAVLSRLPVKRHANHPLPSYDDGEQRGVLEVVLQPDERSPPFTFFATHLDSRREDRERLASVEAIEKLASKQRGIPMILAGDLNAVPTSRVLESLQRTWHRTGTTKEKVLTFPAEAPRRQIDYVLVRPADRWKVVEVRAIDEPVASDHRPILAVLELPPEGGLLRLTPGG